MMEDEEIIRRCREGRTDLLDVLIERYKTELYSLCMRLARRAPDADDLFQDTWVRVMKRLDGYSSEQRFKPWLFAICVNRYRDLYRWRKRWGRRRSGGEDPADIRLSPMAGNESDPEQRAVAEENMTAARRAIDALEDALRLPVVLHYFEDLSTEEIGRILEIPQGTVKSRLHAARGKLRGALEDAGYGR
ncbi:MAG: sigma-70 family RNA polymerase sigma factor [Chitinivibrionia bacterium]|nr:sigma-70 family RNA polymerase sigma factor [Chitinivibrionia bacterium]